MLKMAFFNSKEYEFPSPYPLPQVGEGECLVPLSQVGEGAMLSSSPTSGRGGNVLVPLPLVGEGAMF
jgi:hypothetical protein